MQLQARREIKIGENHEHLMMEKVVEEEGALHVIGHVPSCVRDVYLSQEREAGRSSARFSSTRAGLPRSRWLI